MHLLVVEDNELQRSALVGGLTASGFTVAASADGGEGLRLALGGGHDLLILDVMLPGLDGFGVLRQVRAAGLAVPVLMLTARDGVDDRVRGLDLGADDYLTKPFAFAELLARVRARMRSRPGPARPRLAAGDLELDAGARAVHRGGREIALTPREFVLLECLMERAGEVVSRAELGARLYAGEEDAGSNTLDVFVSRVRRKLALEGLGDPIRTRRGQGWMVAASGPGR